MKSAKALDDHIRAAQEEIVAVRDTITKRREQTSEKAPETTQSPLNSRPEIPLTGTSPLDSIHANEAADVGTDLPNCTSSNDHHDQEDQLQQDGQADMEVDPPGATDCASSINHDNQESHSHRDLQTDTEVAPMAGGILPIVTRGSIDDAMGGTTMAGEHILDEHEPFQNEMSNITTRVDSMLGRDRGTGSAIDLTQPEVSNDGFPQLNPRASPSAPSISHGIETLPNDNIAPTATASTGALQSRYNYPSLGAFETSQSNDIEMTEPNSAPALGAETTISGHHDPLNPFNIPRPAAPMQIEFGSPANTGHHFPQAQKRPREPSLTMWGPARVCRPRIQTENANLPSITPRSSLSTVYSPMERVGADGLTDAERERLFGYMRLMGGMGGLPMPY